MANPTTNFGWQMPQNTDLVKDLPADFEVFGQAVDTDLADLKGGTTGQVLSKTTNTDLDFTWITPTDQTPLTTKGDLFTFSTVDARLPVGTNGYYLTADSAETTGLKWTAPAGGGKVLQVVQATYSTEATSTSTTWADTGLSASITPSATNSKILVLVNQHTWIQRSSSFSGGGLRLLRGSTDIYGDNAASAPGTFWTQSGSGTAANMGGWTNLTYLDSPNTTSSTTYKTQFAAHELANSGQMKTSYGGTDSSIILLEIGA